MACHVSCSDVSRVNNTSVINLILERKDKMVLHVNAVKVLVVLVCGICVTANFPPGVPVRTAGKLS